MAFSWLWIVPKCTGSVTHTYVLIKKWLIVNHYLKKINLCTSGLHFEAELVYSNPMSARLQSTVYCGSEVLISFVTLVCQVFDFTLEEDEMKSITALNKGWRYIVPMIQVSGLHRKTFVLSTLISVFSLEEIIWCHYHWISSGFHYLRQGGCVFASFCLCVCEKSVNVKKFLKVKKKINCSFPNLNLNWMLMLIAELFGGTETLQPCSPPWSQFDTQCTRL